MLLVTSYGCVEYQTLYVGMVASFFGHIPSMLLLLVGYYDGGYTETFLGKHSRGAAWSSREGTRDRNFSVFTAAVIIGEHLFALRRPDGRIVQFLQTCALASDQNRFRSRAAYSC